MNKNSNERRGARFNIIDAVIVIAVLALVAAAVWLILLQGGGAGKSDEVGVNYTLKISMVREEFASRIKVGDTAQNSSTGAEIGKITAVSVEKSKFVNTGAVVTDENGESSAVVSEYPDLYDVSVTIRATATTGANGVAYVEGYKILIGSSIYFRDASFAARGFITNFETVGN